MEVIALRDGFAGGSLRQKGATFNVPDGSKSTWFAPVDAVPKATPKASKAQAPATLSQMGKGSVGKSQIEVLQGDGDLA